MHFCRWNIKPNPVVVTSHDFCIFLLREWHQHDHLKHLHAGPCSSCLNFSLQGQSDNASWMSAIDDSTTNELQAAASSDLTYGDARCHRDNIIHDDITYHKMQQVYITVHTTYIHKDTYIPTYMYTYVRSYLHTYLPTYLRMYVRTGPLIRQGHRDFFGLRWKETMERRTAWYGVQRNHLCSIWKRSCILCVGSNAFACVVAMVPQWHVHHWQHIYIYTHTYTYV